MKWKNIIFIFIKRTPADANFFCCLLHGCNLTGFNQSIPINGIASLTLSVDVLPQTGDVAEMLEHIEEQEGIHYVKILARE